MGGGTYEARCTSAPHDRDARGRSPRCRTGHGVQRIRGGERQAHSERRNVFLVGLSTHTQSSKPSNTSGLCTDVRGFPGCDRANIDGGRFYDNGHCIGHDEPTRPSCQTSRDRGMTCGRRRWAGAGRSFHRGTTGSDVTIVRVVDCAVVLDRAGNPNSYPQAACKPISDSIRRTTSPGMAPRAEAARSLRCSLSTGRGALLHNISCDNAHCASLHIDDLECTVDFRKCNTACVEPTNFAWIQKNGVPHRSRRAAGRDHRDVHAGRPDAADESRRHGEGPRLRREHSRAVVNALEDRRSTTLTTGQSGYMQRVRASNGFMATKLGRLQRRTPFNYEPEYSTAKRREHHPLGSAANEHQHAVRDRALDAMHVTVRSGHGRPARLHRRRSVLAHLQRAVRGGVR